MELWSVEIRDAPIDRPPIDIGRYSLSTDRSVLSKNADCESRSHDVKWLRKIHDTFLCARQNKLAKMASPVWQYFKVSEKDNKIAVCNVCEAEILQLRPLWRTGERSKTHTKS